MYDLSGEVFGRLTVIQRAPNDRGRVAWLCNCRCGNVITIRMTNALIRENGTRSCGYCRDQVKHPIEYMIWDTMKYRCYNTLGKDYHNYGGRGITVCARWKEDFLNFLGDMGKRPNSELSIDRINNDGNYEPTNCRWATRSQQQNNKRISNKLDTKKTGG